MPLFNPPSAAGITVTSNGFITIDGHPEIPPFKPVIDVDGAGAGIDQIHIIVEHPTEGEVSVAFTDVPTT